MFEPVYSITDKILIDVGVIDAAREVIDRAPLVPTYEADFRKEALIRTVHFGTKLEGNDLSLAQAEKVMETSPAPEAMGSKRERDVQEVINYREVMAYLDRLKNRFLKKGESWNYTEAQLKKIHRLTVDRILSADRAGEYRQTQVVIRNLQTQEVTFRPPPAVEVPYHIEDFLAWLNSITGRKVHPVLRSGVTHYELARIHPFVDGNGRAARAMTLLVLFLEGYEAKRFFSLEEYYDRHAKGYYEALQSVEKSQGDMTQWLEFFTTGLAEELVRIKDKVVQLSAQLQQPQKLLGKQVALTERQIKILEAMKVRGGNITSKEATEVIKMISKDTVIRDLNDLIVKGVLRKEGSTKASRYVLV